MKYNTEQMRNAMMLARHAYSDRIDRRGKSCFLLACEKAEKMTDDQEAVIMLLQTAMEETSLTLADMTKIGFGKTIINALLSERSSKNEGQFNYLVESLTA